MTDFFLRIGLSNACFSLALAIVAMVVGAKTRRPHLTHLLWLLVIVKLVTPPIVTIPVVRIPRQPQTAVAFTEHSRQRLPLTYNREFDVGEQPDACLSAKIRSVMLNQGRTWLPPIWLLGSVVVFAWSLLQVYRFSRLLGMETEAAPHELQAAAANIASRLELKTIPTICTTSARLSPMVWWAGGKVRIVISTTLLDQMDAHQWQWILAHELAHVRRRDYLVRWLEWLACVCFWWNPVMWWARYNLRANEELCCDALVVSSLNPKPHTYANSLLQAVEILACPALRPPAMASEINSGGFLQRRFKRIVSGTLNRRTSRWLQACVLLGALLALPLGIASSQDYDALGKRLRAVVALTQAQQASDEKSAAPDNKTNLIVPGERVGRFTIGATKAELIDKLGQPRRAFLGGDTFALDNLPDKYFLVFSELSFLIQEGRVQESTALSPRWKLASGVAVGVSEEKVRRTMGPDYVLKKSRAKDFLLYPKAGVSFEIDKTKRTVMEISVQPKPQP